MVQLVGEEISGSRLLDLASTVDTLYTYNGGRFDLPYLSAKTGVDFTRYCRHRDLMYDCWAKNLYGGLKTVERFLGIGRRTRGIDGRMAVLLWFNYRWYGDEEALATLLEYNREDVMNLRALRQKLIRFVPA
jgi:hypothetical protein